MEFRILSNTRLVKQSAVFAIKLKCNVYVYCQIGVGDDFGFFDYTSTDIVSPEEVVKEKIAFRVCVSIDSPVGCWLYIGKTELHLQLQKHAKYKHVSVGSKEPTIYSDGVSTPSDWKSVEGLEDFSIWFAEHIEERLNEVFCGQKKADGLFKQDYPGSKT